MTTLYECDWCGEVVQDRAHVASTDVTIGSVAKTFHLCVECAPDHLKQHYPE